MKIAIHQSNFMPWYPFFQKMDSADVFVIMGNCQYEKGGYQNRFNIDNVWLTMSVGKGIMPIVEKKYVNPHRDWERIKKTCHLYKKELSLFESCISESLFDTNSAIIEKIRDVLGIKCRIVYDYPTSLTSTERLIDICKKNSADTYVSGISGAKYLDTSLFAANGIKLKYQKKEDMLKRSILEVIKNGR